LEFGGIAGGSGPDINLVPSLLGWVVILHLVGRFLADARAVDGEDTVSGSTKDATELTKDVRINRGRTQRYPNLMLSLKASID